MFKTQVDRDDKIRQLFSAMDSLFTDVQSYIEGIPNHADLEVRANVLSNIARQTSECAIFIRDYASDTGFGTPRHSPSGCG